MIKHDQKNHMCVPGKKLNSQRPAPEAIQTPTSKTSFYKHASPLFYMVIIKDGIHVYKMGGLALPPKNAKTKSISGKLF
jgi:hypothetical protein